MEGSLSCYTCSDTGPRFFRSHLKDRPIQSPLTTNKGMWRIYSTLIFMSPHSVAFIISFMTHKGMQRIYYNPDPYWPPFSCLLRHTRVCGGSTILWRIYHIVINLILSHTRNPSFMYKSIDHCYFRL
jgi:hypothetical protein